MLWPCGVEQNSQTASFLLLPLPLLTRLPFCTLCDSQFGDLVTPYSEYSCSLFIPSRDTRVDTLECRSEGLESKECRPI